MNKFLLTFLILSSQVSFSQMAPPHMVIPPMMPQSAGSSLFKNGNQVFELSISGLQKYTESVKSNEQLYNQIKPELDRLSNRRYWAIGSASAAVALGVYLISDANSKSYSDDEYSSEKIEAKARQVNYGILSIMSSVGIYYLLNPDREDLLDFINFNNKLSDRSLELSFQFSPAGLIAKLEF